MKRYVGGDFQVTKNTVFHYDEYGSIIQRDYVPKEYQDLGLPVSTYYKYDYDKYNNWYKCYIYMEGTNEGEPTALVIRELEYYEDQNDIGDSRKKHWCKNLIQINKRVISGLRIWAYYFIYISAF